MKYIKLFLKFLLQLLIPWIGIIIGGIIFALVKIAFPIYGLAIIGSLYVAYISKERFSTHRIINLILIIYSIIFILLIILAIIGYY